MFYQFLGFLPAGLIVILIVLGSIAGLLIPEKKENVDHGKRLINHPNCQD